MPSKSYLIQQAATLLKYAKETHDPSVAVVALDKAVALNEVAEHFAELDLTPRAPGVIHEDRRP